MSELLSVHELIPLVMADVGHIGKNKKMQGGAGSYNYRGIDDVFNAFSLALSKHGVFYVPFLSEFHQERDLGERKNGTHTRVVVEYTFYGPKGDSVRARFPGENMDFGSDKSTNKAMQAALKYMMLQMFCVATEEQVRDDADAHGPQEPPPPSPKQQAATQKPQTSPKATTTTASAATDKAGATQPSPVNTAAATSPSNPPPEQQAGLAELLQTGLNNSWSTDDVNEFLVEYFTKAGVDLNNLGTWTREQYDGAINHLKGTKPRVH